MGIFYKLALVKTSKILLQIGPEKKNLWSNQKMSNGFLGVFNSSNSISEVILTDRIQKVSQWDAIDIFVPKLKIFDDIE